MSRKSIICCDICRSEDAKFIGDTSVVFTTNQDDGKSTNPYIELVELDMCSECEKYMIDHREMPLASGAMGYNTFEFKSQRII